MLREQGDVFGPVEGGGFARGVDAGLAPGGEQVELLGRDVELARVVEVVLDAEGAAVELRSADLDELADFGLDAGVLERVLDGGHAGGEFGHDLLKVLPVEARRWRFASWPWGSSACYRSAIGGVS